jgi:predicted XRE-type DNA-binding protein
LSNIEYIKSSKTWRNDADKMDIELLKRIEYLYYDEKMSTRKVANILNIQQKTVITYLNKYSKGTRDKTKACLLRSTTDYREKIRQNQLGELNNSAKLTKEKVIYIRHEYEKLLLEGYKKTEAQHKLAKKFGVKRPTISDIVLRKTWKHI